MLLKNQSKLFNSFTSPLKVVLVPLLDSTAYKGAVEPCCTSQKPPHLLVVEVFTSIPPGEVAQQTNSSLVQEYICDRFTEKLVFKTRFHFPK